MSTTNNYSAGEQALGYIYQSRFALFQLLQMPEDVGLMVEKDDDLDFEDNNGEKSLASLKHKAKGEKVTDLSTDFWKSVRIWLDRYNRDGSIQCNLRFILFTTSEVAEGSFLESFLDENSENHAENLTFFYSALSRSKAEMIVSLKTDFDKLTPEEQEDFVSRIFIVDNNIRIEDIPDQIIKNLMRTVRREFRIPVYERLEGWWNDLVIKLLTNERKSEIRGFEVSDKLSSITDEFKSDNLPIDFRGKTPDGEINIDSDERLFVEQLRAIGIKPNRIQHAIHDYYRAFEQRSSWARENVLLEGEVVDYEERIIDEWSRYRDVIFEDIEEDSAEEVMSRAGRELYKWAELNTGHLRIRERVSEPYVVRGSFHILANHHPLPKVYWHPLFMERLEDVLTGAEYEKVE